MIKLTKDEQAVLALIVVEKDIQPPHDSELTEEQEHIAWRLKDLRLATVESANEDEWVWRPTFEGLTWKNND